MHTYINMSSYQNIKDNLAFLIKTTILSGMTIEGAFDRACVEHWLGPLEINDFGPAYLQKFQAAIAILKIRKNFELPPDEELKQLTMYLLAKLSKNDILAMGNENRKALLSDATTIFELNSPIIYSVFEV